MNKVDEDDLYEAMDWLLTRQAAVEKGLARMLSENLALSGWLWENTLQHTAD